MTKRKGQRKKLEAISSLYLTDFSHYTILALVFPDLSFSDQCCRYDEIITSTGQDPGEWKTPRAGHEEGDIRSIEWEKDKKYMAGIVYDRSGDWIFELALLYSCGLPY